MRTLADAIQEIKSEGTFLGGPEHLFEEAGRKMLMLLLNEKLMPYSKLLDIGCGCLRGGYWLIRFLDEGSYFGIEPNEKMLNIGKDKLLDELLLEQKRPQFDHNTSFDASVFDTRFDFFLARSIWTHASKSQILNMLDSFVENTNTQATFLTSYLEAKTPAEEYEGEGWIGKSHESGVAGVVKHSFAWVKKRCEERSLKAEQVTDTIFDLNNNQRWIRVTKEWA